MLLLLPFFFPLEVVTFVNCWGWRSSSLRFLCPSPPFLPLKLEVPNHSDPSSGHGRLYVAPMAPSKSCKYFSECSAEQVILEQWDKPPTHSCWRCCFHSTANQPYWGDLNQKLDPLQVDKLEFYQGTRANTPICEWNLWWQKVIRTWVLHFIWKRATLRPLVSCCGTDSIWLGIKSVDLQVNHSPNPNHDFF